MYIIVGLGNPGKKYERTRHNIGFLTIDELSRRTGIIPNKLKFKATVGEGRIGTEKVVLVKPQTFMNLSGESVRELMSFYKVDHDKLIVIYDDIDLEVGKLRIRKKGSSGTHNGMRNIIYLLGYDDFPRFRVGISGENRRGNLADYVLGNFLKEEIPSVAESIERCADAIECLMKDGIELAMTRYNG